MGKYRLRGNGKRGTARVARVGDRLKSYELGSGLGSGLGLGLEHG